jgi:O-antigen/teichoic acid export membrane protein
MRQSQRIAKNMTLIVLSEIVGFGLHLAVMVLIARYLGAQGFGHYSFILAFVWVFQLIGDFGLSNIMVREISVDRETLESQLAVTKSLIWLQSLVVFILIVLTINFINLENTVRVSFYIMGLATLAMVHAVGYSSIFRAMEEMEYNAIGFVSHKALLLIMTLIVIYFRCELIGITAVNCVCNMFLWVLYYLIVRYRYAYPKLGYDFKAWRYLITESIPIGIANVLRGLSLQVGILILTALAATASVGLFSAPYKITQSLSILPQTLTIALFPYFSRLARFSRRELFDAYEKNLKFMYLLSIPLVIVFAIHSKTIIDLIFGHKFASAHIALQLLSFSIVFLFQTSQFAYLFSSIGKQRLFTICSISGLAVNIILDLLLIPRLDFIGACIGALIAEVVTFGMGVYFIKTVDKNISFIRASWKPLVSGVLMASVLYLFRHSSLTGVILGVVLGSLVYILSVGVLRTFSSKEISLFKESFLFLGRKSSALHPASERKVEY